MGVPKASASIGLKSSHASLSVIARTGLIPVTLVHEYAHALLHSGVDDEAERSKRELEAEAVGYIVGRHFELDTSGSAFYLAAWHGDEPETILDRLERISSTAQEIIDIVSEVVDYE